MQPVVAARRELQRRQREARPRTRAAGRSDAPSPARGRRPPSCSLRASRTSPGSRQTRAIQHLRSFAEQALRPDQQDQEQREDRRSPATRSARRRSRRRPRRPRARARRSARRAGLPMPPSTTSDSRIAIHSQCLPGKNGEQEADIIAPAAPASAMPMPKVAWRYEADVDAHQLRGGAVLHGRADRVAGAGVAAGTAQSAPGSPASERRRRAAPRADRCQAPKMQRVGGVARAWSSGRCW